MILLHHHSASDTSSLLQAITLPHPGRAGSNASFLLDPTAGRLFELHASPSPLSALVGDSVVQNATTLLLTPFDPAFLLLHLAASQRQPMYALSLDSLLPDYLAYAAATHPALSRALHDAAAVTCAVVVLPGSSPDNDDSDRAYRLDRDKAHSWLTAKAQALAAAYAQRFETTATSSLFPAETRLESDPDRWLRRACDDLRGWVQSEWIEHLERQVFCFAAVPEPDAVAALAHAASLGASRPSSSINTDAGCSSGPAAKKRAPPASAKKPAAVPKSQRSVASFFGKKSA
ncbi:Ydr279p protein family-domain-containing protein [Blastocladiella britannica]|nr:Ydr279p protein family-domain-containing protein [Blastocladiella britannica]